jgi:hypothetical protein
MKLVAGCLASFLSYSARATKLEGPDKRNHNKEQAMKIGILGTGMVGEALGTKFVQLGHQVKMGSRTASNETAAAWVKSAGQNASQGTFADAAQFGEIVFICLKGTVFLEVAKTIGPKSLDGKALVDVSNPLSPQAPSPFQSATPIHWAKRSRKQCRGQKSSKP